MQLAAGGCGLVEDLGLGAAICCNCGSALLTFLFSIQFNISTQTREILESSRLVNSQAGALNLANPLEELLSRCSLSTLLPHGTARRTPGSLLRQLDLRSLQ